METHKVSKADQKLSKKTVIFNAAMSIFMEKGYGETRMIDIAKEAGIGKGTIYEYFSSKEELFFEMFFGEILDHSRKMERIRELQTSPDEKLKAYLELEFDQTKNCRLGKGIAKQVSLNMFFGKDLAKNEKISMQIRTLMEERLNLLINIIEEGVQQDFFRKQDPYLGAVSVLGIICFGIAQCHEMLPGGRFSNLEEDVEKALYQFILNGLSK